AAYCLGGGVIYTQAARRGLLRVPDEAVKGIRSSSEPYALLKARTVRELLGATWGLAETGASGPTGNRYGDAAGHACFAVAGPVERAVTLETAHGDREKNMWAFAKRALELLEAALASRSDRRPRCASSSGTSGPAGASASRASLLRSSAGRRTRSPSASFARLRRASSSRACWPVSACCTSARPPGLWIRPQNASSSPPAGRSRGFVCTRAAPTPPG